MGKYIYNCDSISDFEIKSANHPISRPWVSITDGWEGVTYSPALDTGVYECVDLGLPSGKLWAACNIGATSPEDYGDYFAWGEVTTKEVYNWSTYAHGSSATSFSKYNQNNSAVSLSSGDNAAVVCMGGFWTMPTVSDFQELIDETTSTWETLNGVVGKRFSSINGNSIFIPAGGNIYNSNYEDLGTHCYLWAISRIQSNKALASMLVASSNSNSSQGAGSRQWGVPVRGVFFASRYWYNRPSIHR